MLSYLRTKIDDGISFSIKCPALGCKSDMLDSEIHPILDETYKSKRLAISLKLALSSIPDFKFVDSF